jgi:peptidyl-prolyl cis-trans isomerase C
MTTDTTTTTAGRWLVLAAAVLLTGCPPEKPSEIEGRMRAAGSGARQASGQAVVARINGEPVHREDLERRVENLPAYVRARYRTVEKQQEYLASIVQFEVLADVAERRGLGEHPSVRRAIEAELADRILDQTLRRELSMEDIPKEAVEEAYRDRAEEFRTPEQRRGLVLATGSKARAERLRTELVEQTFESVDERLREFRRLANAVSSDPVAARQAGDVGWIEPADEQSDHPELAGVLFGLDERGEISEVFAAEGRWYVATWAARRPASEQDLREVSRDIRTDLYEQRKATLRDELGDRWRAEVETQVDDGLADRLDRPDPPRLRRKEEIPIIPAGEAGADEASSTSEDDGP